MDVDVVLLILRVAASAALLAFLGAVFVMLWRDYRAAAGAVEDEKRPRGRLVVISASMVPARADRVDHVDHVDHASDAPAPDERDETGELDEADEPVREVVPVGTIFPLLPLTSVGRAPTNTIVLDDTFCSQAHALITRRDGQWWLEDRGSSNGTLLNGELIAEPVVVSSGDVIGVGQVQLKLELA